MEDCAVRVSVGLCDDMDSLFSLLLLCESRVRPFIAFIMLHTYSYSMVTSGILQLDPLMFALRRLGALLLEWEFYACIRMIL